MFQAFGIGHAMVLLVSLSQCPLILFKGWMTADRTPMDVAMVVLFLPSFSDFDFFSFFARALFGLYTLVNNSVDIA